MEEQIVNKFKSLEAKLCQDIAGPVHLVRVKGARWSYVAGEIPTEMPFAPPVKVALSDEWALLLYPAQGKTVDIDKMVELFTSNVSRLTR